MQSQIKEIYNHLSKEHNDLAYFTDHLILSINQFKEERVKVQREKEQ